MFSTMVTDGVHVLGIRCTEDDAVVDVMDPFSSPPRLIETRTLPRNAFQQPSVDDVVEVTLSQYPQGLALAPGSGGLVITEIGHTSPAVAEAESAVTSLAQGGLCAAAFDPRLAPGGILIAVNGKRVKGMPPQAVLALVRSALQPQSKLPSDTGSADSLRSESKEAHHEEDSKEDGPSTATASPAAVTLRIALSPAQRARPTPASRTTTGRGASGASAAVAAGGGESRRASRRRVLESSIMWLRSHMNSAGLGNFGGGDNDDAAAPTVAPAFGPMELPSSCVYATGSQLVALRGGDVTAPATRGGVSSKAKASSPTALVCDVHRGVGARHGTYRLTGRFPIAPLCSDAATASSDQVLRDVTPRPTFRVSEACHIGVTCDMCGMSPIYGPRFKDLDHYDYDLCHACYTTDLGDVSHSFQLIEKPGERTAVLPARDQQTADEVAFSRATVPSGATYDPVLDCVWLFFAGTGEVQRWRNAAPLQASPGDGASTAVRPVPRPARALALDIVHALGRVARAYLSGAAQPALVRRCGRLQQRPV